MGQLPSDSGKCSSGAISVWKIDVNRATRSQWCQLPGCTKEMADLLIKLQEGGVQFSCAEDLFTLFDLNNDISTIWKPHLIFRWHGTPPLQNSKKLIDINIAQFDELMGLNWSENRVKRLILERRQRSFVDLADLQNRLCLPASSIEALIGHVCFKTKPSSPSLPTKLYQ